MRFITTTKISYEQTIGVVTALSEIPLNSVKPLWKEQGGVWGFFCKDLVKNIKDHTLIATKEKS